MLRPLGECVSAARMGPPDAPATNSASSEGRCFSVRVSAHLPAKRPLKTTTKRRARGDPDSQVSLPRERTRPSVSSLHLLRRSASTRPRQSCQSSLYTELMLRALPQSWGHGGGHSAWPCWGHCGRRDRVGFSGKHSATSHAGKQGLDCLPSDPTPHEGGHSSSASQLPRAGGHKRPSPRQRAASLLETSTQV